ncbi:hypothetical protein ACFV7Q_22905 [Streptomyces sp. NPDC059851]|uniref:hypothetical protein n=1 Tax=Streptomyces sp. NPDC059851 TaxID=3346971 RepID=UPI003661FC16
MHRDEAAARRADSRRAAYVELAASTNRYVQQSTQLLNVSLGPAKSADDGRRQFEDGYAPANTDVARALTTARLVTTENGRRELERIGALSARVGETATEKYARRAGRRRREEGRRRVRPGRAAAVGGPASVLGRSGR